MMSLAALGMQVNGVFSGGSLVIVMLDFLLLFFDLWFTWISYILRQAGKNLQLKEREITFDDEADVGKRAIN